MFSKRKLQNFACRQPHLVSRRCEVLLRWLGILPREASLPTPQRKICEGRWARQTMPDNESQLELLRYISLGPGLSRGSNRSRICPYLNRQTQLLPPCWILGILRACFWGFGARAGAQEKDRRRLVREHFPARVPPVKHRAKEGWGYVGCCV